MMPMRCGRACVLLCLAVLLACARPLAASGGDPGVPGQRADLWRARIQSFLDQGVLPLVDLESRLRRGRGPLGPFIAERAKTMRLILRDLPQGARRDIAFGNAWRLLTGVPWE